MDREVFLDTGYAVAVTSVTDQHHQSAVSLAQQIVAARRRIVTTRAVLMEIGNTLSGPRHRAGAVQFLMAVEADPTTTIIPLDDAHYARSLSLFQSRKDKEWGLVDCFSFVVMQERGIQQALTADEHFEQAAFQALLRIPAP